MKLVPQNINEAIKHLKGAPIEEINKVIDDALQNDNVLDALEFLVENNLLKQVSTSKLENVIKKIEGLETSKKFNDIFLYTPTHLGNKIIIINLDNYKCYMVGLFAAKQVIEALYELL